MWNDSCRRTLHHQRYLGARYYNWKVLRCCPRLGWSDVLAMVSIVRQHVFWAVTVSGEVICAGASVSGAYRCAILVADTLKCGECIRGTSVSWRAVGI